MVRAPNPTKETVHDEALGSSPDRRVLSHAGARHRVGHVGVDAILPGDRNGRRRRRRRLSGRATKAPPRRRRQRGVMLSRGRGPWVPPLVLFLAAVVLIVAPHASAQQRHDAAERVTAGSVYRRPLGNDPVTLDPARISDVY